MRAARGQRWLQKEDQYLGPHEGQWSSQFSSYGAAGVEQGFLVTMQSRYQGQVAKISALLCSQRAFPCFNQVEGRLPLFSLHQLGP